MGPLMGLHHFLKNKCPNGGIGRHVGLKNPFLWSEGSIPSLGTILSQTMIKKIFSLIITEILSAFMLKKIKEIKKKIKLAKIWAIIFWIIFVLLIVNNIYNTYKINNLETKIEKLSK